MEENLKSISRGASSLKLVMAGLVFIFLLSVGEGIGLSVPAGDEKSLVLVIWGVAVSVYFFIFSAAAVQYGRHWPKVSIDAGTYRVLAVVPSADGAFLRVLLRFKGEGPISKDWDCLYSFPRPAFDYVCLEGDLLKVTEADGYKRLTLLKETGSAC